jgi:hypothetical protein
MLDSAGPSQDGPTVFALREAAAALGISRNTLRRRIAAGQIRAEQVERPQGFVWQVYLDGPHGSGHGSNGTVQRDSLGTVQEGSTLIPPTSVAGGADLMRAEAMAAYTRSLLEPLVARMAEQEVTIRDQAETIGRQAAELDALRAQTTPAGQETASGSESTPEAPVRWWRSWGIYGVVGLVLLAGVILRVLGYGW